MDIFIDQFKSFPVALLGVAAGLSVITGGVVDAVVILAVVGINAAIGFVTESDSERTINSLKKLIRPYAQVRREGSLKRNFSGPGFSRGRPSSQTRRLRRG